MLAENQYYSYNAGELPVGCQFCVRGEKLVLFVTGICPRQCYFCPLSDRKYGVDTAYANERVIESPEDVILEAELMAAKGAGITGGDPLSTIDRTVLFIQTLKQRFGRQFHIHLYTSLTLVTETALEKLFTAGLDEIRFHPDLDVPEQWKRITLAKKYSWDIGIEIPLIPTKEKEIKALVDFVHSHVQFLNLNELERADNSLSKLSEMGFATKERFSYAINGSLELGLEILHYIEEKNYSLPAHLCTAKLKDKIQLANRLKRESKYIKKAFDVADAEGMLTRGALYLPELAPGFGYRKKLETADKKAFIEKLLPLFEKIKKELSLKEEVFLDAEKPRILLARQKTKANKKYFLRLGLLPAVVKEYPTADQLELEVEFLK